MVYELYGLSEEEIEIVEKSLNVRQWNILEVIQFLLG
jgi:hypothetical protein